MDNSLSNRIEIVKKNSRLTIEEFVTLLGVSKQSYSSWINGTYPNSEILIKILTKFPEYNAEWLLLGTGEMKKAGIKHSEVMEPQSDYGKSAVSKADLKNLFTKMVDEIDNL